MDMDNVKIDKINEINQINEILNEVKDNLKRNGNTTKFAMLQTIKKFLKQAKTKLIFCNTSSCLEISIENEKSNNTFISFGIECFPEEDVILGIINKEQCKYSEYFDQNTLEENIFSQHDLNNIGHHMEYLADINGKFKILDGVPVPRNKPHVAIREVMELNGNYSILYFNSIVILVEND